jgi:hypothetical protein
MALAYNIDVDAFIRGYTVEPESLSIDKPFVPAVSFTPHKKPPTEIALFTQTNSLASFNCKLIPFVGAKFH